MGGWRSVCGIDWTQRHFCGLRGRERLNRPVPAQLSAQWSKIGQKLAEGGRLVYKRSSNREGKMEIPVCGAKRCALAVLDLGDEGSAAW